MNKIINQMIREYLEQLAAEQDVERDIAELRKLSKESKGDSKSWRFDRDEIYDRS